MLMRCLIVNFLFLQDDDVDVKKQKTENGDHAENGEEEEDAEEEEDLGEEEEDLDGEGEDELDEEDGGEGEKILGIYLNFNDAFITSLMCKGMIGPFT